MSSSEAQASSLDKALVLGGGDLCAGSRGGKTVARMPSSSAVASCNNGIEHSGQNIKDNEYARLVTPAEHATADKKFCLSNQS